MSGNEDSLCGSCCRKGHTACTPDQNLECQNRGKLPEGSGSYGSATTPGPSQTATPTPSQVAGGPPSADFPRPPPPPQPPAESTSGTTRKRGRPPSRYGPALTQEQIQQIIPRKVGRPPKSQTTTLTPNRRSDAPQAPTNPYPLPATSASGTTGMVGQPTVTAQAATLPYTPEQLDRYQKELNLMLHQRTADIMRSRQISQSSVQATTSSQSDMQATTSSRPSMPPPPSSGPGMQAPTFASSSSSFYPLATPSNTNIDPFLLALGSTEPNLSPGNATAPIPSVPAQSGMHSSLIDRGPESDPSTSGSSRSRSGERSSNDGSAPASRAQSPARGIRGLEPQGRSGSAGASGDMRRRALGYDRGSLDAEVRNLSLTRAGTADSWIIRLRGEHELQQR